MMCYLICKNTIIAFVLRCDGSDTEAKYDSGFAHSAPPDAFALQRVHCRNQFALQRVHCRNQLQSRPLSADDIRHCFLIKVVLSEH